MGSALTYSGVTLQPKGGNRSSKCLPVQTEWEATRGLYFSFLFFFSVSSAFAVSLPLAGYVGCRASGVDLYQKQELQAPQGSLWDGSCPSFMLSGTSSSGRSTFLQKRQVSWCGQAERAALSCLVRSPLPFVSALAQSLAVCFSSFSHRMNVTLGGFFKVEDDLNACEHFPVSQRLWSNGECNLRLHCFSAYFLFILFPGGLCFLLGRGRKEALSAQPPRWGIWCELGVFTVLQTVWHRASVLVAACLNP